MKSGRGLYSMAMKLLSRSVYFGKSQYEFSPSLIFILPNFPDGFEGKKGAEFVTLMLRM